jgi:hypothetical protein
MGGAIPTPRKVIINIPSDKLFDILRDRKLSYNEDYAEDYVEDIDIFILIDEISNCLIEWHLMSNYEYYGYKLYYRDVEDYTVTSRKQKLNKLNER